MSLSEPLRTPTPILLSKDGFAPDSSINFLPWSRAVKLDLAGKKKLGYVTGPPHTDPSVGEWDHPLVMYRLLNSMEPTVSDGLLFANTAKVRTE